MKLRSEIAKRSHSSGFTILEAILAFAVLGMILAGIYKLSSRTFRHQTDALAGYERSAMARALLEEYIITYPEMEMSGTYKNRWAWIIREEPQAPLEATSLDHHFDFRKVTASVRIVGSDDAPHELSTVVARRASSR